MTLFERLGNEAGMQNLAKMIAQRIGSDRILQRIFVADDAAFISRFLTHVCGGPNPYTAGLLRQETAPLRKAGLNESNFEQFIIIIGACLAAKGSSINDINDIVSKAYTFMNEVLNIMS